MLTAKQQVVSECHVDQKAKRHADVNRNAVLVAKIATGEDADDVPIPESEGKNAAAVALGRTGGKARAEALGKRKRTEIAWKAVKSRWKT